MPPVFPKSQARSQKWRLAGLAMVVFAIGLTVVGTALAFQQAQSLEIQFRADARYRASDIAATARAKFLDKLNMTMRETAILLQAGLTQIGPPGLPPWIDGLYVWDTGQLTALSEPDAAPDGFEALLRGRLEVRHTTGLSNPFTDRVELMYDNIGDVPIVVACRTVNRSGGAPAQIAARIDILQLRATLLDPLLTNDPTLELIATPTAAGTWAHTLSSAMRFWSIQPNAAAVRERRNTILGQTFIQLGLTVLSLGTILAAMWLLVRLARREMALAELKGNFVADVSHELKTPLALIRLYAETLESGRVAREEKRMEYYSVIMRESTRLTNMIDNILDFSRIEAGRKEYVFVPTSIGDIVNETYQAYGAVLDHNGFEHHLRIDPDLPRVPADRDAISRVLLNLMSNSIKYCSEERFLAIEVTPDTRRDRHGVLISVKDRGIGISAEDRPHLFEGFYRASDGRVREKRGAGLGLALVKHVVDAHKGSLGVESRLVRGTTFRIFLPAVDGDDRNTTNQSQTSSDVPQDGGA